MIRVEGRTDGEFFNNPQRIIDEEMNRGMARALILSEAEISSETPVGVTALLRTGIRGHIYSPVAPYYGSVRVAGPAVKYAEVVEVGRDPGRMPPDAPIRRWLQITDKGKAFIADVKQKYGIKTKKRALDSATWLKRKGVAEQGTRGAFMFEKSEKKLRPAINAIFERARQEIEKRLSDK